MSVKIRRGLRRENPSRRCSCVARGTDRRRARETIPAGVDGRERIAGDIESMTMLARAATLEDVGNVAAFVASDRARTMTAATANISCGALVD